MRRGIVALGERVPVAAVGAHDVVVRLECGDGADGDTLLAQVRVEVAADVAEAVLLDRALLEPADGRRRLVHAVEQLGPDLAHRAWPSPWDCVVFCGLLWHASRLARQQLLPADRLQVIADFIRERGSVRSRDLVRALGVTDETIRRDLARLAEQGLVRRAHGGALAVRPSDETDTAFRLREHALEKAAIGRRAAELVADGSSIILDSGPPPWAWPARCAARRT